MPFSIDTTAYDKARHHPVGFSRRASAPTSIVIHSTNNKIKNTPFANEANYLFTATKVSSHYLIGKEGRIVQFLDPRQYEAWHAGGQQEGGTWTAKPDFANPRSVGIELHHSVGDGPYPAAQIEALTWLVRELMARFRIPIALIDTHRAIALPARRKTDPNDWTDLDFYRWRAALDIQTPTPVPADPWPARWGTIALPDQTTWNWAIPAIWKQHHARLGKCLSPALYGDGFVVQLFEGGDVRGRNADTTPIYEVCFR
jgi:hypothetical protein